MSLTDTPRVSRHGLSTTIAWRRNGRTTYALEGNISVSVQAAAWMATFLGLPDVAALTSLAETSRDAGVVVVPAFAGLGAPHWDPEARAAIVGLSLASTRADAARATLEAIALQIRDVFGAMESDLGHRLDRLAVDGGPTRNETLMQLQADLLDRPVRPHQLSELSAAGAGVMAGVACGLWSEAEGLAIVSSRDRTFEPAMSSDRRVAILARWQAALRSVRELSSSRDHAEDTGFADATG
jgi:glycerol kinase